LATIKLVSDEKLVNNFIIQNSTDSQKKDDPSNTEPDHVEQEEYSGTEDESSEVISEEPDDILKSY